MIVTYSVKDEEKILYDYHSARFTIWYNMLGYKETLQQLYMLQWMYSNTKRDARKPSWISHVRLREMDAPIRRMKFISVGVG